MKTVHRPSVIPIYAIGAVWIVFCLAGSLHRVGGFLACAAASAAAFFVLRLFFPGTDEQVEQQPDTGSAEVDAIVKKGRAAVKEIRTLNDRIADSIVSAKLDELQRLTGDTFAWLERHPEQSSQLNTFLDYYLPTTLKLLRSYEELQRQSVRGENIRKAMHDIEAMLDTVVAALRKQLDSLYASQTIDITADIAVLEQMMAAQGLSNKPDF